MATVGRRIAGARIESGLTQQELADAVGLSLSAVQQYERGTITPRPNRLRAIAEALGKPLSYFRDDDAPGADSSPSTVTIGGVAVSGPADKLAEILQKVQQQQQAEEAARPAPAVEEGRLPNPRHTGIYEILALHTAGELRSRYGVELSMVEEEGLRTYGRSGPAVDTIEKAIEVILQWREWELKDQMRGR